MNARLRGLLIVPAALLALASAAAGREVKVSIKDLKFDPAELSIKVGDIVIWTNNDSRDHQIKADDASFESENLRPGAEFRQTFKSKGKFDYGCAYHPRMRGRITVTP